MSGMDYSQFEQLANNVKDLAKDYDKFLDDFLVQEGNRCLANTKRRTPVDTGALRNRWKLAGPFKRGGDRYVVIHNNLNYASFVEEGHRLVRNGRTLKWVNGRHMARIALTQTQNKLDARFEKAFSDFCKARGLG